MSNFVNWMKVLQTQPTKQFGDCVSKKINFGSLKHTSNQLHVSADRKYVAVDPLPIPVNIDPAETTRFSPYRARDISATAILTHQSVSRQPYLDITLDNSNADPHVESYDCFGAVSLTSSMQSNVPSPFGGMHKFTHLNMPGGQWSQDIKFMSHDLQNSHYTNLRRETRAAWSKYDENATCKKDSDPTKRKDYKEEKPISMQNMSRKDQLKKAFKEYGSTVIVFHVGISLISLEICYLLVSSGVDVMSIIDYIGLGSTALSNKITAGASTFVIAYAIHKVFAPIRMAITLAAAPIIVSYLRKKGFLKTQSK